jgi:hypothetical protein
VSSYRYTVTNALTGQVLADRVPLVVRSMTRAISGVGRLDGYLSLSNLPSPAIAAYLRALIPDQSVIWCLQDGYPIWCGLFTDSQHTSIKVHQLPITAYTPESIMQARLITGALVYDDDILTIARNLVRYATSSSLGPNAQIAGLSYGTSLSGVTASQTFGVSNTLTAGGNTYTGSYSDNQAVYDALTTFAAAVELEFEFAPRLNGTALQISFRLGYPALGRYNTVPAPIAVTFPGQAIDYARPVARSQSANWLIGTAASNNSGATFTSAYPHGVDSYDLDQGHILRMSAITWSGSGPASQAQVNQWTDTQIIKYGAGTLVPQIVLGGGQYPKLTEIGLGDTIGFSAISDLDPPNPDGTPSLQVTGRVTGWSLQPPGPGGQAEELTLTMGELVGSTALGTVGAAA